MSLVDTDLLLPSPIQHLLTHDSGVELYLKREDLIHPLYGGNKWRKLKYNLLAYKEGGYTQLVTFGGPFSNHIAAVALACQAESIPCVGLIRGTYEDPNNPTLLAAKAAGMKLIHITKEAYRDKESAVVVQEILSEWTRPFVIPEGGSNALGFRGCAEISEEVRSQGETFDYVLVPAGTGTTAAGIISSMSGQSETLVVNVLRNPGLKEVISQQLTSVDTADWRIVSEYHFGGFAKVNQVLVDFINNFSARYGISIDPIYNGKGLYATMDLLEKGYFSSGSKVLYILTGGQQGIRAYNYRCRHPELGLT